MHEVVERSLLIEDMSCLVLAAKSPRMIRLTSECLLNVNHLPRTRLHKPTPPLPRPLQPLRSTDHPPLLQITLVPRHNLHRLHGPRI